MTTADILRQRLVGQMLAGNGVAKASEVVRRLGAVQAQEYGPTKWSLGMRTARSGERAPEVLDADVEKEVNEGRILRTHLLRPTWHFVHVEDLRWMLELSAPRVHQANAFPYRRSEMDAAVFRKSNKVVAKALADGEHLTRDELGVVLDRAGVDIRPNRLAFLMMRAELDGVIVSGVRRGKLHTYALFDARVPPAPAIDRDEALERLALRYFPTRGPATAHDFAWWSGLTLKDVRRAVDIAGTALERVEIDDRDHWMASASGPTAAKDRSLASTKRSSAGSSRRARSTSGDTLIAHLLPVYDEFFIGLKDRNALGGRLTPATRSTLGAGVAPQFGFVNGKLVARWRRTVANKTLVVEIEPLTRITAVEKKRISAEAAKLAEFMELPLELKHGQIQR